MARTTPIELDGALKGDHGGNISLRLSVRVLLHGNIEVCHVRVVVLCVVQLKENMMSLWHKIHTSMFRKEVNAASKAICLKIGGAHCIEHYPPETVLKVCMQQQYFHHHSKETC